jgi:hypothetical protein
MRVRDRQPRSCPGIDFETLLDEAVENFRVSGGQLETLTFFVPQIFHDGLAVENPALWVRLGNLVGGLGNLLSDCRVELEGELLNGLRGPLGTLTLKGFPVDTLLDARENVPVKLVKLCKSLFARRGSMKML